MTDTPATSAPAAAPKPSRIEAAYDQAMQDILDLEAELASAWKLHHVVIVAALTFVAGVVVRSVL